MQPFKARRFTQDLGRLKKIRRATGMPDMTYARVGQSMHTASRMSHQKGVPSPLYTTCTQSQRGAKILYNKV